MSADKNIPYGRQTIDSDDIEAVSAALRGDYLTGGPIGEQFESALSYKLSADYSVACANGTAALHLAALALGLGPGDCVIVPALTFLATANAVRYVGAEVWFADVDPGTGLLTVELLNDALVLAQASGRCVKAVFSVHLNGQVADPVAIYNFAQERGLKVVEDASHAIGTVFEYNGESVQVGSCLTCDLTTFSFHPVKSIAMGEGGAVTCKSIEYAAKLRLYRSHGMIRNPDSFSEDAQAYSESGDANPWYYEMHDIGYNYRVSDINSALGLSQLAKLDGFARRRKEIVDLYDEALLDLVPIVRPIGRVAECRPVFHLYVVQIDFSSLKVDRAYTMKYLADLGIKTQVHYLPVNRQPYYRKRYGKITLHGADEYYEQALSLPLYPLLTDEDVNFVVRSLRQFVLKFEREKRNNQ
jgi:UDP-4-amino-4,6-dideoxy-N-acetyl-beta-L-altrosamine transaminase